MYRDIKSLCIEVQVKTVYGNDLIYPICSKAKSFTALTKTKTLSKEDIAVIKALGYSIKATAQEI